jgi:signal transduction histidine kinase
MIGRLDALRPHSPSPRFDRLPPGHRVELPDPIRADPGRLRREIRAISESPVVTAVLEVADAVLLVLNRERQIVGFNSRVDAVRSARDVLGLRPGELLGCANAAGPGGCGTLPGCTTCGALGAVLRCQALGRPVEAECLIRCHGGAGRALEFNVRATPVTVGQERFTVVSLRDISGEKRRDVLEQVFLHDVLNTVAGLRGWAQRMQRSGQDLPRASERIEFLTGQLEREIKDHRALVLAERGALVAERLPFRTAEVLRDVAGVFGGHPVARERQLEVLPADDDPELLSDRALLLRVLVNMVRNALEATEAGGVVRLWSEADGPAVCLRVHSARVMEPDVQARVFQRSFSTKGEPGRGLGTYSMKLFGEHYLGGEVSFVSSAGAGTVFTIRLPRAAGPRS